MLQPAAAPLSSSSDRVRSMRIPGSPVPSAPLATTAYVVLAERVAPAGAVNVLTALCVNVDGLTRTYSRSLGWRLLRVE